MQDKIRTVRKRLDLTQAELAERIGVSTAAVGQWETAKTVPSQDSLHKLSDLTGEPIDWFFDRQVAPKIIRPPEVVPAPVMDAAAIAVRGTVQAGVWRHVEPDEHTVQEYVRVPLDRAYDGLRVYGLRVAGASMNLVYPPGTILLCVKLLDLGREPRNGERVIVLRQREGDGSELTVKEFRIEPNGEHRLYPRSTHPAFQEPLQLPKGKDAGEIIEVQSVVIASVKYEG